jgi:hypothetical protein
MLCDDKGYLLFQLKMELTTETANYRTAYIKCEEFNDLKYQFQAFKNAEPHYNNASEENRISTSLRE